MRNIVIDETLQDMDKDKDGFVTLEEYISKCEGPYVYVCYGGIGFSRTPY